MKLIKKYNATICTKTPEPPIKQKEKNLAEIGGTGHALLSLISVSLSNYQYETRENEKKRSITLLRPSYLDMFKEDLRRIMRYDRNSQYISPKLIKSENTNIVE